MTWFSRSYKTSLFESAKSAIEHWNKKKAQINTKKHSFFSYGKLKIYQIWQGQLDYNSTLENSDMSFNSKKGIPCNYKKTYQVKQKKNKMIIKPITLYGTKCGAIKKHIKNYKSADLTMFRWMNDGIRNQSIRTDALVTS